ncbi:hypothetical protein P4V72_00095 [Bacillus thuringiensis]|uniref:Uncharacterized protein n=1 Tax=Bacillus thuringiensis TaxID=1428 RepID=A0A9W3TGM3_BACTU|nr:hypothetical protein [Bacillus thuringiensis]AQY41151.1 hypothetical protein B4918_25710 [Bacillus thuringiensis]MDR4146908.1 hypothetical protein [Bacillus thuringiensis]MEC3570829.1 hypothetical protein [Bacillus thuringiensis]MED2019719.1 hypothetical protein [Bacillus thuringiensis]MED2139637.1 hypothetical protein [Bacillus thuringiensis]
MNHYGKLFINNSNSQSSISLETYNPDKEKYFEIIKRARGKGLRQVIINSELMLEILYQVLENNGVILKVNLSDSTDDEIKDNINSILPKIRQDKELYVKLREELEWAVDSGSIDIFNIEVYVFKTRYQIFSNGIINSSKMDEMFEKVILPVLRKYFNAR